MLKETLLYVKNNKVVFTYQPKDPGIKMAKDLGLIKNEYGLWKIVSPTEIVNAKK